MTQPSDDDWRGPWKTALCECRICGNKHVAVYPWPVTDEMNLECPNCGYMTCQPVEEEE